MSDSLKAKMEENTPGIDIYPKQRLLNSAKGVLSESEISRRNKKLKPEHDELVDSLTEFTIWFNTTFNQNRNPVTIKRLVCTFQEPV